MPPTPEQWKRIKDIVADALELPTVKRDAFVQQACKDDPPLVDEVQSLLAFQHTAIQSVVTDPGIAQGSVLLGRYLVERTLGQGGFATAWLAFDQQLSNRRVVVKLLGSGNADPYIRRKFADELRALSALEHPNIIAPLDSGLTASGVPFIVTQFAEGSTLAAILNEGTLSITRSALIIAQIGRTLSFIHAAGIIHRDLKPENIVVQTFAGGVDHVRLIDFGIASIDAAGTDRSTRIVGSFVYMAPEQLRGVVSMATDVYALGVIAYEMLTGELPFSADNPVELARLHAKWQPVRPKKLRPEITAEGEDLLLHALQREPEKRPVDAARFAEQFAQALRQTSQTQGSSKRFMLLGSLSAVGLLMIGVFFTRHKPHPVSIPRMLAQQAPSKPTLASPITLELERKMPAGRLTPNAAGQLALRDGDEFRIVLHTTLGGHLYLFSTTVGSSELHILYPSTTSNSSSLLTATRNMQIPRTSWFRMDDSHKKTGGGNDQLELAWSATAIPAFEGGIHFANVSDKGVIPEGAERAAILDLLRDAHPFAVDGSELQLGVYDGKSLLIGQLEIVRSEKELPVVARLPPNTLSSVR